MNYNYTLKSLGSDKERHVFKVDRRVYSGAFKQGVGVSSVLIDDLIKTCIQDVRVKDGYFPMTESEQSDPDTMAVVEEKPQRKVVIELTVHQVFVRPTEYVFLSGSPMNAAALKATGLLETNVSQDVIPNPASTMPLVLWRTLTLGVQLYQTVSELQCLILGRQQVLLIMTIQMQNYCIKMVQKLNCMNCRVDLSDMSYIKQKTLFSHYTVSKF